MAYTKKELAECANREVAMRVQVYPRRVVDKRMKQIDADKEIDKMRSIYRVLINLPDDFIHQNQE